MQFYVVYIQEAHPSDGWQVEVNERECIVFEQPTTVTQRAEAASACSLRLDISIPTLLDDMTDTVEQVYGALPDRLYLIDEAGRVTYRSDPGPWGFQPDEFEEAIRSHLSQTRQLDQT